MNAIHQETRLPGPPREAVAGMSPHLRSYWRVFWRGKYLLLSCWILLLIPAALYLSQARPQYTSSIKIMIEGAEAGDLLNNNTNFLSRNRLTEATIITEAEVLSSSGLARRVIDKLRLYDDPEFNPRLRQPTLIQQVAGWLNPLSWFSVLQPAGPATGELSPEAREELAKAAVTRIFLSKVKVTPVRRSYILVVSVSAEGREKAAKIANTLGALYVTDRLEAGLEEQKQVNSWLAERLDGLRRDVAAAEEAAEKFRAANNLRRPDDSKATVTDQQLSELNSRLVLARTDLAEKQAQLDRIRELLRSHGGLDTATEVLQSPLIQHLREQEAGIQRSLSEASKTYGDRHPKILAYRAELSELQGKIAAEKQKIAESKANEVDVAASGVRTLERELDQLRQRSDVAGQAELRLRELQRQAQASRTLYEAFLAKFKGDSQKDGLQRANARIISPATLPTAASAPKTIRILLGVSALAWALGTAVIFLLYHLDGVIRSSDESEEITGLTTLAVVPLHRSHGPSLVKELLDRPRSALVDAIRSLRITLDAAQDGRPCKVVVVSSSVPREGKTFVSLCLATIFARTEGRTLLIDGDLHKPTLNTVLGVPGERGFAQVLDGSAGFDDVLIPELLPNLDFLPGGPAVRAGDLVTEPNVTRVLELLAGRYDRIVIDSPPVLAVSDARVLARLADRLVYLVRWNKTPREAVRNGIKLLAESQARVDGIVLSQVDQRKHSLYAYGDYGHYYGRYREYYGE